MPNKSSQTQAIGLARITGGHMLPLAVQAQRHEAAQRDALEQGRMPGSAEWIGSDGKLHAEQALLRPINNQAPVHARAVLAYSPKGYLARAHDANPLRLSGADGAPLALYISPAYGTAQARFKTELGCALGASWSSRSDDVALGTTAGAYLLYGDRRARSRGGMDTLRHADRTVAAAVAFDPHRDHLLIAQQEGNGAVLQCASVHHASHAGGMTIDPTLQQGLPRFAQPIARLSFSPDGSRLVAISTEGSLYVLPGRLTRHSQQTHVVQSGVCDLSWSPDGHLALLRGDGAVQLMQPSGRLELSTYHTFTPFDEATGADARSAQRAEALAFCAPNHLALGIGTALFVADLATSAFSRYTDAHGRDVLRSPICALAKNPVAPELAVTCRNGLTTLIWPRELPLAPQLDGTWRAGALPC